GARDDLVHRQRERIATVARGEPLEPQFTDPERASLRREIAEHAIWRPRVRGDDSDHARIGPIVAPHLRGRDPQALVEVIEDALDTLATRPLSADVGVMHDVHDEADECLLVKDRLRDEKVGEMARTE